MGNKREIRQQNQTILLSVAGGIGAVALALFAVYASAHPRVGYGLLGVGIICAVAVPIIAVLYTVRSDTRDTEVSERERALKMLVELVYGLLKIDEDHDLRVTVLGVNKARDPHILEQKVRYSGKSHVLSNSTMTVQQGLAGQVYRKRPPSAVRTDVAAGKFHDTMIDLGFSLDEAKRFTERGNYCCAPIVNGEQEVIAVLCLDAKHPNVFGDNHVETVQWLSLFFSRLLAEGTE
jgi:GAF domain-containing protein